MECDCLFGEPGNLGELGSCYEGNIWELTKVRGVLGLSGKTNFTFEAAPAFVRLL